MKVKNLLPASLLLGLSACATLGGSIEKAETIVHTETVKSTRQKLINALKEALDANHDLKKTLDELGIDLGKKNVQNAAIARCLEDKRAMEAALEASKFLHDGRPINILDPEYNEFVQKKLDLTIAINHCLGMTIRKLLEERSVYFH